MDKFDNDSLDNLAMNKFNGNLRKHGGNVRLDSIVMLSMVEFAKEYSEYILNKYQLAQIDLEV